jgi:hypothetical protein
MFARDKTSFEMQSVKYEAVDSSEEDAFERDAANSIDLSREVEKPSRYNRLFVTRQKLWLCLNGFIFCLSVFLFLLTVSLTRKGNGDRNDLLRKTSEHCMSYFTPPPVAYISNHLEHA